jgi:D-glycero-D-manno-heptose 1,7-bisphosphate phosphatase
VTDDAAMMRWARSEQIAKGRCLFLDRDGVINDRGVNGYVLRAEDFRLRRGAAEVLRRVSRAGLPIVVVSNQSCIGRGLASADAIRLVMERMVRELEREGVMLDAWYCCPHAPDDACECRKPGTAMFRACAAELGVSLRDSYMIGDSISDVEAGNAAGCLCWLIDESQEGALAEAVDRVLTAETPRAEVQP